MQDTSNDNMCGIPLLASGFMVHVPAAHSVHSEEELAIEHGLD